MVKRSFRDVYNISTFCGPSHLKRLHWSVLHVQVPNLHRQVVSGHHVASIVTKLNV